MATRAGATSARPATTSSPTSSGCCPAPDIAGPIFEGIASEPETGQALRDSMSRLVRPDQQVFSAENFKRWFAAA